SALVGPPKYSPTIAPIIDRTAAIFSPVNMKGSELGMRTRRNVSSSPPPYERISSIEDGCTDVSPRRALIIVGKKQSTGGMTICETGLIRPNQLLVIGANAMIGTALAAIASGMRAVPTVRNRASSSAARTPRLAPIANPPSASLSVYRPACHRAPLLSQNDFAMSDGLGRRNV